MSDLFEAIDALTLPRTTGVMQGDRLVKITHDPLLVQLEQAITSAIGNGGGGGTATGAVINDEAFARFAQIASQVRDWCRLAGVTVSKHPGDNLRAWGVQVLAADTSGHVTIMRTWARQIVALLDPPKRVPLAGACPVCGAKSVTNELGDVSPNPVQVEYYPENPARTIRAVCRAVSCGVTWEGGEAIAELVEELNEPESDITGREREEERVE